LQIGLERMDGGLIHVWYHHLLVGHLRVGRRLAVLADLAAVS